MDASTLKSFLAHPVVAILGLLVAPVGLYHWSQSAASQQGVTEEAPSLLSARPAMAAAVPAHEQTRLVKVPGVRPTEYHSVSAIGVLDTEPVIGVVVDGKPRAYLVNALCSLKTCVVNDVHAGRAISVMYAIESGSPRVLVRSGDVSGSGTAEPIELGIHGLVHRDLFLSHQGRKVYFGGKVRGLRDFPYAHCAWGVWKNAYPDTDIYTGDAGQVVVN